MTETNENFSRQDHCRGTSIDAETAERTYKYLRQLRDMDNELMWTRSNVILLVQGGLLAILTSKFDILAE